MGKRGPARKPANVKKLQGTYRKDRDGGENPSPAPGIPNCPSFLKGEARREWKRVAPELANLGLYTELDRAALAAYCSSWGMYVEVDKVIREEGLTYLNSRGRELPRPEVAIRRHAIRQMRSFATEFGMTPSSRGRITLPDNTKDEYNPFLGIRG